jgi:nucleotidyltransferase substrate binding protein (TIGR01987 family)
MENKDIRWKQRYQNFKEALSFLSEAAAKPQFSELEKAGVVQSFEFTFELAWKTMKDFLNEKGLNEVYPKEVIKSAFQTGLITNGEVWLDMLSSRNLMSHTYHHEDSEYVFHEIIAAYVVHLNELSRTLKEQL